MKTFFQQSSITGYKKHRKGRAALFSLAFPVFSVVGNILLKSVPVHQLRFQKSGVKSNNTVNSSRRPSNISSEQTHLAASGSAFHEKAGPKAPSPGPVLPMLDITTPIDSVSGISSPINISMQAKQIKRIRKVKASTVDCNVGAMTCLFILIGNTALGCSNRLNSFFITRTRMTMRIHFIPPEVLPAQAPINISMGIIHHAIAGHVI